MSTVEIPDLQSEEDVHSDGIKIRQLNAIVGAAIRALVESGADDESIGSFAATHRTKVSAILGQPELSLQQPDLADLVQKAVLAAIEQKSGIGRRQTTERFNVIIAGRRTSLSINKEVVSKLTLAKGSRGAASKTIRRIAVDTPSNEENKSAWVEERILTFLDFSKEAVQDDGASRH